MNHSKRVNGGGGGERKSTLTLGHLPPTVKTLLSMSVLLASTEDEKRSQQLPRVRTGLPTNVHNLLLCWNVEVHFGKNSC
ncbi:hypothetical protein M0802_005689 [Mischocyttarus mexicanus]|nr:hypothetical protein M0802_005689 [Mischocyttarus mexicanus]